MNDSREYAPCGAASEKQEAMREKLEQRRERQAAKREKYRKLAADKSARQRRRRKKKEAAMLDALVKSTNHGGFRVAVDANPIIFEKWASSLLVPPSC